MAQTPCWCRKEDEEPSRNSPETVWLTLSDFLRVIAPRIAYANPSLPFAVERIRNDPRNADSSASAAVPGPSMTIEFRECLDRCRR